MGVLYAFSNVLNFILWNIVGFRKKVIITNLKNSFPEKNKKWINKTSKEYYRHMCDLIVESIKFFTINQEEALQMMTFSNTQLLDDLYKKGRNVILVGGHYGNWELFALTIAKNVPHVPHALYAPMANAFMDQKMRETRSRYGLNMHSIKRTNELFNAKSDNLKIAIFGSDQSPRNPAKAYWLTFLNQDTGVMFGAERFAKLYNYAVVYGVIHKLARGKYNTEFKLICENPNELPHGQITEMHTNLLEEKIKQSPDYWLWSHRRWKRKRPEGHQNIFTAANE